MLTKSEQQIAKDKLRIEFAHRISGLPKPPHVTAAQYINLLEVQLESYLNAHLDLIVAFYRDNYPTPTKRPQDTFGN